MELEYFKEVRFFYLAVNQLITDEKANNLNFIAEHFGFKKYLKQTEENVVR